LRLTQDANKNSKGKIQRKQFGSIIYGGMDKVGKKGGRDLEVYIPRLMDDHNKISFWEESENLKKKNISKEYSHQA
jgi:hypothetical protein